MNNQLYPTIQDFYEDFEKESSVLGEGTFGVVYKLKSQRIINKDLETTDQNQFSGRYFAVKIMEASSVKTFEQIQKEYLILRVIPRHPNIIDLYKTYAWCKQQPPTYSLVLVMELADRNLLNEIRNRREKKNHIPEERLLYIFRQCIETFRHLIENQNIFHRDIKPENILLMNKDTLEIKITDFGVSKQLLEEKFTILGTLVGTPVYLSPILWHEFEKGSFQLNRIGKIQHNFEKSDVFSLGVTLLQCTLLLDNEVFGLNHKGGQEKIDRIVDSIQCLKIKSILQRMLKHDEKLRATYQELLQEFFYQRPFQQLQPQISKAGRKPSIEERVMNRQFEQTRSQTPTNYSLDRKQNQHTPVGNTMSSNNGQQFIGNLIPPSLAKRGVRMRNEDSSEQKQHMNGNPRSNESIHQKMSSMNDFEKLNKMEIEK